MREEERGRKVTTHRMGEEKGGKVKTPEEGTGEGRQGDNTRVGPERSIT